MRHIYRVYDESCLRNFTDRGIDAGFISYDSLRFTLVDCMQRAVERFDSPVDEVKEEIRREMEQMDMPEEFWDAFGFPSMIAAGSMNFIYDFMLTIPRCGGITYGIDDADVERVFGHDGVRIDGIGRIDWEEEHPF